MRIALAQINVTVGDLIGNQAKIVDKIDAARKQGADIVVFPELAVCGYPPEDLLHKKHFIDNNINVIKSIAKHTKDIVVIVGYVDRDRRHNIYNAAAVIADGKTRGVYRKNELPNYSVFDEKRYFTSDKSTILFEYNDIRFAVNICEDIWNKKGIALEQSKQGAQIIFNISCSPYEVGKIQSRDRILSTCAKSTNAHLVYLNLVGGQDELVFDGSSVIVNPKGDVIAAATQFDEDLLVYNIKTNKSSQEVADPWKVIALPSKKVNKKSLKVKAPNKRLKVIEEVYCALILGTRDYIHKNGFEKVVIGLSGGIDSALVAAIACDAIGASNVIGVTMPSQYSSTGTRSDAKKLAENLGIEFMEIPIGNTFKSYLKDLEMVFKKTKLNVAEENLQARIRGNLLMALSNKFGWLVLTTGNKSEMAVGYCTLYGDMSGGYAVIKDIVKTKVYKLCEFRNKLEGKDLIPQTIIKRAPSAELRDNQKDQDSLPPYNILDKILIEYIEKHKSFKDIIKIVDDKKTVQRVIQLVDRSEYKRRQGPPGVKITPRAFGKDWRLPITNKYQPQ